MNSSPSSEARKVLISGFRSANRIRTIDSPFEGTQVYRRLIPQRKSVPNPAQLTETLQTKCLVLRDSALKLATFVQLTTESYAGILVNYGKQVNNCVVAIVDNVLQRGFDEVDRFSSVRIDFLSNIRVGQTLYVRNQNPGHRPAPKPCYKPSKDQDHAPCKPRPSTTDRSKRKIIKVL